MNMGRKIRECTPIELNPQRCETCSHYIQHYTYQEYNKSFIKNYFGHCTYPQIKQRKLSDTCQNWQDKDKGE